MIEHLKDMLVAQRMRMNQLEKLRYTGRIASELHAHARELCEALELAIANAQCLEMRKSEEAALHALFAQ